ELRGCGVRRGRTGGEDPRRASCLLGRRSLPRQRMPGGQRQLETRLLVGPRHAADVAAVQPRDVAGEGESEPVPGEGGTGLGAAVETLEQALRLLPRDAGPGAGDPPARSPTLP